MPDEFNGREVKVIILTGNSKNEKANLRTNWERFLADIPKSTISEEEILSEVNEVRAARYDEK